MTSSKNIMTSQQMTRLLTRFKNEKKNSYMRIPFALLTFVLILLIVSVGYENYIAGYFVEVIRYEFFISVTLVAIFPFSAIGYVLFQRDEQIRKLARDFWLLGIDIRDGDILPASPSPADWQPSDYENYIQELESRSPHFMELFCPIYLNDIAHHYWAGPVFLDAGYR